MADYQKIVRLRPEVREFIRNRRWVHRGEAIAYGPNIGCDAFSTDGLGYRHNVFKGETLSTADVLRRERFGLILGPSNVYGFGCAGNENTMPSLLAEKFGFPFANIGLPEGNSRNLFSILLNILMRNAAKPSVVVHVSGGDYTSFCYTGLADPVFGPPNLKQIDTALQERGGRPKDSDAQMRNLLRFSTLWTNAMIDLARASGVPFSLADDSTFFEKAEPSELERKCKLGEPSSPAQTIQFETHKKHVETFWKTRRTLADKRGVPIAGPGHVNTLGFVDEFHYDNEGTRSLVDDFAPGVEEALSKAK